MKEKGEEKIEVPTFLKWAGGKRQLLNQFDKKFPREIDYYVEPFLGGGAVLFYVTKYKNPKSVRVYDSNKELINVYLQVKNNVKRLMDQLETYEKEHNKRDDPKLYYYKRRTEFNTIKKNKLKKAALFIYLNKACFNGLYRVNSKGEFNVPFNGSKKIKLFDKETLIEASNLLKNVEMGCKDFIELEFHEKETIYFDPPYWSEPGKNGFTSYTNPDFNEESQKKLAYKIKDLYKKGCKIILSNSNTKLIKKLYTNPSFNIYKNIEARRMINCNGDGRYKINEILVTANF